MPRPIMTKTCPKRRVRARELLSTALALRLASFLLPRRPCRTLAAGKLAGAAQLQGLWMGTRWGLTLVRCLCQAMLGPQSRQGKRSQVRGEGMAQQDMASVMPTGRAQLTCCAMSCEGVSRSRQHALFHYIARFNYCCRKSHQQDARASSSLVCSDAASSYCDMSTASRCCCCGLKCVTRMQRAEM